MALGLAVAGCLVSVTKASPERVFRNGLREDVEEADDEDSNSSQDRRKRGDEDYDLPYNLDFENKYKRETPLGSDSNSDEDVFTTAEEGLERDLVLKR